MGYNVLSGSTSAISVISSGSFIGDGSRLENVKQFELYSAGDSRLPFFKLVSGKLELEADTTLTFNAASNVLTVPAVTSSVGIKLSSPISGALGGLGSFLGLDADGNMVVTSSAAGSGPVNSLQFHTGGGNISGSSAVIYSGSALQVSGSGSNGEGLVVTGSLLPGFGDVYDIGSPDRQWRSLYVSSSTIYFGGESLSVANGSLKFGSGSVTKGFHVGHMHLLDRGIVMDPNRVFQMKAFQMQFHGGVAYKRNVVSWDYQVLKTDYMIGVQSDTLTASVKLTLPDADACVAGQTFVFKDEGGNCQTHNIVISASNGDKIDGNDFITLESPYSSVNIYTNGINKYFIY